MCYGDAEQAGQEGTVGSVDKRWTSTTRLRRVQGGVLITFLGFQQTALHSSDLGRGLQLTAAVLAGCSFFAMLAIGWTLLMRCVDERRKAVLQRSVLIGVAITMGIACVAGYLELALRRTFSRAFAGSSDMPGADDGFGEGDDAFTPAMARTWPSRPMTYVIRDG